MPDLQALVLRIPGLVVGFAFHEFAHGFVADRLGDPTPRRLGRLSLNPVRHLEPFGTIMMLLVGFGWGKPVPVNSYNLQGGRRGMGLVALAGPVSNLLLVFALGAALRLGWIDLNHPAMSIYWIGTARDLLESLLKVVFVLNIVLAVFNLLPIPPLDGSNVLLGILPDELARPYARLMPYGPIILLAVIMIAFLVPQMNLLGHIMNPVIDFVRSLALGR